MEGEGCCGGVAACFFLIGEKKCLNLSRTGFFGSGGFVNCCFEFFSFSGRVIRLFSLALLSFSDDCAVLIDVFGSLCK